MHSWYRVHLEIIPSKNCTFCQLLLLDWLSSETTTFWQIVFPLIASSVVGVGLLGFTLSYDEFTRTSLISGETNTLPLEIFGMTTNVTSPALYALVTLTTIFSFVLIGVALLVIQSLSNRQNQPKKG